ncbi:MAG: YheU family protein [Gammaproteobacteria bacterium]
MSIPLDQLTPQALQGVIDAFILREGTDYGHQEFTLDEKRGRVRAMLQRGEAEICYYPENEHIDIVLVT